MDEEKKDLEYLFNKVPLYEEKRFDIFQITDTEILVNDEEATKFLKYIGIGYKAIVAQCLECGEKFPFNVKHSYYDDDSSGGNGTIYLSEYYYFVISNGKVHCINKTKPLKEVYDYNNIYIHYYLECTKNEYHTYTMQLLIEFKDNSIYVTKVGNNPDINEIQGFDFDTYKSILRRFDAYTDYKYAELSFLQRFYVGSYTYLRRILEKMVDKYLNKYELKSEELKELDSMEKKIKKVKKEFDPRINSYLNGLYKILSLGIHELSEQECKEFYQYLKMIIDMQLLYIKNNEELENQATSLGTKFTEIIEKLKTR